MALTFASSPSAFPPFTSSSLSLHPVSHSPFTFHLSRLQTLTTTSPFNSLLHLRRFSLLTSTSSSYSYTPTLDSKPCKSPSSRSPRFKTPRRFTKPSKHRHGRISDNSIEHPAFKPIRPPRYVPPPDSDNDGEEEIRVSEKGLSYKLKDAPFEFQYSYTETPKVKPVALREPPYLPFGPKETPRPWTGKAPLPPSKKKLPEFDSFKLPPPGKKGVKPVQKPGPFLAGSGGPRYSATREEILGEPLTKEEVAELVKGCMKTRRQLHMGRDGFTHNMLENIHAHWKRKRVCKIKCLGVCTVDMDNVCQQIEEKTGGKIIERKGGVIFLFRGRNYNYKHRPRYPLMLWKPVSPVYPRLVKRVPDGLTFEEAKSLRARGRDVPPMMKLGKNGVYINLVNQVREAFEVCELVRLNCKGMNKSDYKKIGAKLQDLVPCVLLSFEFEHILLWRGRDWKSSFHSIEGNSSDQVASSSADNTSLVNAEHKSDACSDAITNIADEVVIAKIPTESSAKSAEVAQSFSDLKSDATSDATSRVVDEVATTNISMECSTVSVQDARSSSYLEFATSSVAMSSMVDDVVNSNTPMESSPGPADGAQIFSAVEAANEGPSTESEVKSNTDENKRLETKMLHLEGVRLLLSQAIENSLATNLSEIEYHDADIVYQRSVEFAKTARPGPTFQGGYRKIATKVANSKKDKMLESVEEGEAENSLVPAILEKRGGDIKKSDSSRRKDKKDRLLEITPSVLPHGSLRVDELAKLLS